MIEFRTVSAPPEDADVETASPGYASRFESPVGEWMLATQMALTLDLLKDLEGSRVLDVGGGHGQVAPGLARHGFKVCVLASCEGAIGPVVRSAAESGEVEVIRGDLRHPPVEDGSFDVVLSYRLLAHARDLPALLTGLARPARRSVLVDYATKRSFNAGADLLFAAKRRVERNTRPFLVLSDPQVQEPLRKENFVPRARRPQFFWPMALHRALDSPMLSRGLEGLTAGLGLRALFGSPVIARFDRG